MTTNAASVAYKLKVAPEDFRVEELAALEPLGEGDFGLYRLTKRGWNTADLVHRLARQLGIPRSAVAFAGRKDRHALTTQLVTVKDPRDLSLRTDAYALERLGAVDRPMVPGLLTGNRFVVTLRSMTAEGAASVEANAAAVRREGVPNYFDDQRFGSYDPDGGFPALHLLHGEWEEALRLILARDRRGDPAPDRRRRAYFRDHWWRWDECLAGAASAAERNVFDFLARRGSDYPAAVNRLPHDLLSMVLAAYQSYLWNETARALVAAASGRTATVAGVAGGYVFPLAAAPEALRRLRALVLPTADARTVPRDPEAARLYAALLDREGLTLRSFRLREIHRAFFRSAPRRVVVVPDGLDVSPSQDDDLAPGRRRVTLRFTLPPGSFATMVVKRLTLATA